MRTISARRKGRVNCACVAAVEPYRSSAGMAFPAPCSLTRVLTPCPPLHVVERRSDERRVGKEDEWRGEGNYVSKANRLATSSVRGATDGSRGHWSAAWCVEGAAPPGSQRLMHWTSGSTIQYSHPCAR